MPPVRFTLSSANPVYSIIEQQKAGTIISSGLSSKMILKLLNRVAPPIVRVDMSDSRGESVPLIILENKIGKRVPIIPGRNLAFSIVPLPNVQYDFEAIFL